MSASSGSDEHEEWRAVVGWEGLYEVSSLGRVRSLDRVHLTSNKGRRYPRRIAGRIMKLFDTGIGYLKVNLSDHSTGRNKVGIGVHILVCSAFAGNKAPGMEVGHLDGSRDNNRASNLAWVTRRENAGHRRDHGTDIGIEKNPSFKLSREDVVEMRCLGTTVHPAELAQRYKVHVGHVYGILSGKYRKSG